MMRKVHLIFLMFSTTFSIPHYLYLLWFLFSMVKFYIKVIFYRINCSRLKEYFQKPDHRNTFAKSSALQRSTILWFFYWLSQVNWGREGGITNDVLNFRKVIGFLKFIYVIYLSYIYSIINRKRTFIKSEISLKFTKLIKD